MGFLGTQTDSQNTQSPTKDQALGYCLEWASTMGPSTHDGNFVIAPMSQLGVACAMYHCLENFFGFAEADITNVECVLSNVLTSFDGADTTFPESHGGADTQNYAKSSCACNTELAAAAPSPAFPKLCQIVMRLQYRTCCSSPFASIPKMVDSHWNRQRVRCSPQLGPN